MASLGAIAEFINSREFTLEVGSDIYIAVTNLQLHVGRTEERIGTTDTETLYAFGKGDSFFTATLTATTPEVDSLNTLTQVSANGDLTSTSWKIVARNLDGSTKTFAATGMLRDYDIRSTDDKVEIDIFVRIIGDTVSIS